MKHIWLAVAMVAICAVPARAAIVTSVVEYTEGETTLEGHVIHDDAVTGKRPGVLIVHQWRGITQHELRHAEMLAAEGYVAFVADIYGKGVRPETNEAAAAEMGKYKKDRALLRRRAQAGLETLRSLEMADGDNLFAIGYCFGGGTVLELARSGAKLRGVVSFHGFLDTPAPDDAKNIQCQVLVLHGADDPYVPEKDVLAMQQEMRAAGVDWQMVSYGNAVHAFTHPEAGTDNSQGAAYNEKADKRSWKLLLEFLKEK